MGGGWVLCGRTVVRGRGRGRGRGWPDVASGAWGGEYIPVIEAIYVTALPSAGVAEGRLKSNETLQMHTGKRCLRSYCGALDARDSVGPGCVPG